MARTGKKAVFGFLPEGRFFAGANTAEGFQSFYPELFRDSELDALFRIEGGPGTGKSTLMKAMRSLYYSDRNVIEKNKVENSNLKLEVNECASHIELEGFDKYEMVIALDGELDDNMRYCAKNN